MFLSARLCISRQLLKEFSSKKAMAMFLLINIAQGERKSGAVGENAPSIF